MARKSDERTIESLREIVERKEDEVREGHDRARRAEKALEECAEEGRAATGRAARAEADLVEERRIHRQDVDAAKAQEEVYRQQLVEAREEVDRVRRHEAETAEIAVERFERTEGALQQIVDRIEAEQRKDEGEQRLHLLVEQIDDIARAVVRPGDRAVAAGRRLAGDLGLRVSDEVAAGLGRHLGGILDPTRLDDVERLMRETKASVEKAEERRRDVERLAIARGERVDELQALVDEILPHIQTLVEQLAGEDPAWWVKATRALGELDRWSQSPLAVPPPEAGGMNGPDGLGGEEPPPRPPPPRTEAGRKASRDTT